MRAYSQSQGKVVDIPDNPMMTQGGTQDMNKVFALMMLKNPKQASILKSVHDLLNPEPSEADKKRETEKLDQSKSLQEALYNLGQARSSLKESGSGLQYQDLFGIRSKLPAPLGLGEKAQKTKTAFSETNKRLFETAGKAFTGSERALLEGLILDLSKNEQANKATLNDAEEKILRKMVELGISPQSYQASQNDGFIPD